MRCGVPARSRPRSSRWTSAKPGRARCSISATPSAMPSRPAIGYGAWLHGEAVAAGMVMAADLSHRLGSLDEDDVRRVVALLERTGLPVTVSGVTAPRFIELMSVDKKAAAGRIRFVLLDRLGSAVIRGDVPEGALLATLGAAV